MRTLLPIFQNIGERCPDLVPGESQVLCIQLSAFFLRLRARLRHAPPPKSDFKRFFQLRSTLGASDKFLNASQRDLTNSKSVRAKFPNGASEHQHARRTIVSGTSKNTIRTHVADVALTHAVATAGGSL